MNCLEKMISYERPLRVLTASCYCYYCQQLDGQFSTLRAVC